jgi:hypothetical protein
MIMEVQQVLVNSSILVNFITRRFTNQSRTQKPNLDWELGGSYNLGLLDSSWMMRDIG